MNTPFLTQINQSLDAGSPSAPAKLELIGTGALPSWFDVTGLAAASIAAAGAEIGLFISDIDAAPSPLVRVDQRLALLWFGWSLQPIGWSLPSSWDPIAGDYATADGWIRLHTNAPHHRAAALQVLGVAADPSVVKSAITNLSANELETAIIEAGGCAATMRSLAQWQQHPQGLAVAREPLITWKRSNRLAPRSVGRINPKRPLSGVKVLDLTRVLAGPVSTRFLAAFGAEVLRIDPTHWDEPGVIPEVTPGKQCTGLDLKTREGSVIFENLVRAADILVHGYRPGALAGLGYGDDILQSLNPELINISLCAYGWTGPWSQRRGFDSLVQMSSGIAHEGMQRAQAERPTPLPVQALDHATGYLAAAAALRAFRARICSGDVFSAGVSLARTAALLIQTPGQKSEPEFNTDIELDLASKMEHTDWGPARRLKFPVSVGQTRGYFSTPARALRRDSPRWQSC